jgi:tRNA (cytidine/uridine-2'-O-)-methyltransferase
VIHHSDLAHMTSNENDDQETAAISPKTASQKALLNLVLYQPEIPQNTGNIGRTCVAIGAKLWLIRPLGFRVDDRSLKRAGMDYWEHLDWEVVDSWDDVRNRLPESQVWCLTKTATRLVWDATFQAGDILLFGSESRGLPASILSQNPASNIKLPMHDLVRSLNLASTANTAAYEAVRQLGGI